MRFSGFWESRTPPTSYSNCQKSARWISYQTFHINLKPLSCRTRELDKIKEVAKEKIASFIMDHMAEYFKFVRKRLEHEVSCVISG